MNKKFNKSEISIMEKESKSTQALNRAIEVNRNTFFLEIIWF